MDSKVAAGERKECDDFSRGGKECLMSGAVINFPDAVCKIEDLPASLRFFF